MTGLSHGARNWVWARTLVDELARAGVREVSLAPGSRSTPLVVAAAKNGGIRLRVHLDERSAAFFALGLGKATGRPAAVVTTSGTAVANLFPAVVEAATSGTPLLLLTADRPGHRRGADANQTIDQPGIFGSYVRAAHEVSEPALDAGRLRRLRALACRAVADSIGEPAGPVHLNLPFEKPLEPGLDEETDPERVIPDAFGEGRPERPLVRIPRVRGLPAEEELDALVTRLERAGRGVIVAGPTADPDRVGEATIRLGAATGFPVLADPLSGARWRPPHGATVLGSYDLFLDDDGVLDELRPEVVVRTGWRTTSTRVEAWLARHADRRQVVIEEGGRWTDHGATATTYLRADPARTMAALAGRIGRTGRVGDPAWEERWRALDRLAREVVETSPGFDAGHEGRIVASVVERTPSGESLFVSGSMPIRDLDAYGWPAFRSEGLLARGNRGASGIDGVVSTAVGVSAGTGKRVVAVVGDVAFYHDMNGLLATREEDAEVVFVVVHNDGGGIFHMLPVREHEPHFTPLFATPHGLDFEHAAALYGLPYTQVDAEGSFPRAFDEAMAEGGTRIVEVRTDRDENEARHRAVRDAVRARVRDTA